MKQTRWGYKGTETAINGLHNWLDNRMRDQLKGSADSRSKRYNQIIVEYAIEHVPNFKKRGNLELQVDWAAKKIQQLNQFQHFTQWVLDKKANQ